MRAAFQKALRAAAVVIASVLGLAAVGVEAAPSLAAATNHWAFQPVRKVQPPSQGNGPGLRTPVDAFLLAKAGVSPAAPINLAEKRVLLRRFTYDLTGLPPTQAEMGDFLADSSTNAYSKVVERLLASPRYGEQWGRHWLDVVRYADTAGENTDHPLPHAWRYRNWVIQAFNDDKPYNEFVQEQVAGDILAAEGPPQKYAERVVATGYLAISRRFGHDIDKDMHLTFEDTIDTLGKSFLGLTLGCARCHNHKYDPVSARDYYGLYGVFESTRFAFPGCEPKQQPHDLVPILPPAEVAALRQPYEKELAAVNAGIEVIKAAQTNAVRSLRSIQTNSAHLLASGEIADGGRDAFPGSTNGPIEIRIRAGEMVQLSILPRANHGADTTLVEFEIADIGGGRVWNLTADVVDDLGAGNPHADGQGHAAVWCFLDARSGPALLPELKREVDGKKGLLAWRNGETPSVTVNSTNQPIKAWTTLSARSLFMHPAADGPVAVAWLSPMDGVVRVTGRVVDAHAGGGDGVGWRLEHFAAPLAQAMAEQANLAASLAEPRKRRAEIMAREPVIPVAYAVAEGSAKDTRLQKRGDPEQPGDEVPRKFPELFGGGRVGGTNSSGRLELARWLASPENPLTARVMVNRVWLGHFGRGLVATPNDFGARGIAPTHPEMLDWLAGEFVASGWSVKHLHRLIVLSAAYQRRSDSAEAVEALRFPRRRLMAEEIRDTLLAASGELDLSPGEAHPFPAQDKWSFTQHGPFADNYETLKRSAYVMQKRNRRTPFFALFDGPDPNASTAVRDVTTVPTQALYFMNDAFVHARSEKFAARALAAGTTAQARLDFAFETLFGHPAGEEDVREAEVFLKEYAGACSGEPEEKRALISWSAYARVLFASNELLHLD